jgi:hypothetical protein
MGRNVIEIGEHDTGVTRLVQDRRDDPERTDRWFVECNLQLRFRNEADARYLFVLVNEFLKKDK